MRPGISLFNGWPETLHVGHSFLKLVAMYAAAFLPVVTGLDRQAAVLHPFGPRSAGRKLLGVAWGLSLLLASPQVRLGTQG